MVELPACIAAQTHSLDGGLEKVSNNSPELSCSRVTGRSKLECVSRPSRRPLMER